MPSQFKNFLVLFSLLQTLIVCKSESENNFSSNNKKTSAYREEKTRPTPNNQSPTIVNPTSPSVSKDPSVAKSPDTGNCTDDRSVAGVRTDCENRLIWTFYDEENANRSWGSAFCSEAGSRLPSAVEVGLSWNVVLEDESAKTIKRANNSNIVAHLKDAEKDFLLGTGETRSRSSNAPRILVCVQDFVIGGSTKVSD